MRLMYIPILCLLTLFLVACGQDTLRQADDLSQGDTLFVIDFETPNSFESGDYPESSASLTLENGQYIIRQGGEKTAYIWGQGGDEVQNSTAEVVVHAQSSFENNLYGVMCRLNSEGAGYAFMISSDGFAAIARTDGRSLSFLVNWQESKAVHKGETENKLKGVCVDQYLALYVNDELVIDTEDSTYSEAGQAGLLAGLLVEAGDELSETVVSFDDLTVSAVTLKN